MDSLNNLTTLLTFTGSLDESWFYLVSVAIEARGAEMIPLMLEAIAAARHGDKTAVAERLRSFAERLDELGSLLMRMYESCDSHVFYHRIRPFLAGGNNMAEAGLPNGVWFDDGSGTRSYVSYSGGSNAQSSIIQFFDLVLGIEHRPTGEKRTRDSSDSEGSAPPPPSHNFIKEMRKYMPGQHRRFLEHVAKAANIRDFVERHRTDVALSTAYDACLAMLRAFRDKHIQMVSRYIIVKSREARSEHKPSLRSSGSDAAAIMKQRNGSQQSKNLRGTGGTALIPFLKQARDETSEPAVHRWAERLLSNRPAFAGGETGEPEKNDSSETASQKQIVGLAGTWSVDDTEGGICHW